jgi:hypothetical protein
MIPRFENFTDFSAPEKGEVFKFDRGECLLGHVFELQPSMKMTGKATEGKILLNCVIKSRRRVRVVQGSGWMSDERSATGLPDDRCRF